MKCTRDPEFTCARHRGLPRRGFDRNGFFEVDTGEQKNWTIQLTEPDRTPKRIQALERAGLAGVNSHDR